MNCEDLIAFEREVAEAFEAGKIKAPVHLSGGNENQLIEIFREVAVEDWVFSTWRSHYHALLHGVPRESVMSEIMAGRSMNLMFPEHRFFTSAIVGGICPVAVGVAAAIKRRKEHRRVWCFVGDMTSMGGAYQESYQYALNNDLPIYFVGENNGLSTNTPTCEAWGTNYGDQKERFYIYERTYPHVGTGKHVSF